MNAPSETYAAALDACNRRDWQRALVLGQELLRQTPEHAGVCYIVGMACMELRRIPEAVEFLDRATGLDPGRAQFATQYARVLALARLPALQAADRAMALAPEHIDQLIPLGMIYAQSNAHERAASVFTRVVQLAPAHAASRYALAMSLIFLGDIEAAERELDACIAIDPTFWKAYLSRSLIRRQTAATHHLQELEALLASSVSHADDPAAATCLNMALAKEYEDLASYPTAFEHLQRGKAAARAGRQYSARQDEELFAAISNTFNRPAPPSAGHPTTEPIFVVGMPRSGTTLAERILSSHPEVDSAGELRNFAMALKRLSGSRSPRLVDAETIARARDLDWASLGASYLASTRPATGNAAHFTDKLPHNFLYVGMIANALPGAKIICLRRHPMDTCLSNFRQLFDPGSPFHDYSYDLLDIGRYYILFDRLMRHWRQAFPGRMLEIDYETLVASQEPVTRSLLAFCDLPWNDACLRFEKNSASVATASAAQVRSGMSRGSLDRWRNYRPQLRELHDLLLEAGLITDD